jgi:hypothetical protein
MVVKKSTNAKTKTSENSRGRPTKLTPATKNKLLSMIKMGSPLESACKACRLDYTTVRDWIQRGKNIHPSRKPAFFKHYEIIKGVWKSIFKGFCLDANPRFG